MPAIADLFPSRFVSAADLAKVKDAKTPFVIAKVVEEECINPRTKKPENKWIVYFRGVKKGHRLRKSEAKALGESLGATTEEWVGKTVTLFAVSTQTGAGVRMKAQGDLSFPEDKIPQ